ncbi:MAG TPA: hypothetical protein VJH89_01870, partial [Patescibacteria group bacterium]|nr:hypothetical protein [Patescibacteria group bacterium]
ECTGDPLEDTWYYKLISRNAKNIPLCDPNEEDCEALTCPLGEAECEMTLCDVGNADGIEFTDPVAYAAEYPLEEEEDGDAIEAEEDGAEDDTATAEEAALVDETISETEASIPATDTVAPAQ